MTPMQAECAALLIEAKMKYGLMWDFMVPNVNKGCYAMIASGLPDQMQTAEAFRIITDITKQMMLLGAEHRA